MKYFYIGLGFVFLALGIVGIVVPILPTTPFLLLTLFFFAKGSERLHNWFVSTKIYQAHLKDFHQHRALTKKAKIYILTLSTSMLMLGFYFTPSIIGKSVIIAVLLIKYWFFFFWIKTLEEE
ncbi:YbaN family protein [Aggregatibacter kilianii]|uniref:YbaN family protein n=1 Tax=Aggregatibacter kilianii TaxID=2025884 RepID=UPI000D642B53|nr:YbaN family protein [Aggregatibacter kilianii]